MKIAAIILFALLGGVVYALLNVPIRRYIAKIFSREDYDEDVDGTMTKEEKKKAEEKKLIEAEKKKIKIKEVWEENPAKFVAIAITGAVLSGAAGAVYGFSIQSVICFIFFGLLTMISFIDMATMEIPPELNWSILPLGIISIWVKPEITVKERIIGFFCISMFMLILTLVVQLATGISGAFGFGDMKLMAAAGFLLGWKGIVTAFIVGLFVGAFIGIALLIRKKKGGKEHMPFGPSLCVGLALAALFGGLLIDWYINIIKMSMPNTFGE